MAAEREPAAEVDFRGGFGSGRPIIQPLQPPVSATLDVGGSSAAASDDEWGTGGVAAVQQRRNHERMTCEKKVGEGQCSPGTTSQYDTDSGDGGVGVDDASGVAADATARAHAALNTFSDCDCDSFSDCDCASRSGPRRAVAGAVAELSSGGALLQPSCAACLFCRLLVEDGWLLRSSTRWQKR